MRGCRCIRNISTLTAPQNKSKTWLGLAELRQLFDWEAYTNTNIEYSEQHQVLWCLGRVTALRPGSLCPAARHGRTGPIKWKDFQFFLGDEPGQFVATLGLDHINIKRKQDPTHGTRGAEVSVVPLQLRLPSPQPANIVFSAAHRLLVIAIRRGILQDIDSLDDLFAYDRFQIFVKDRHLNDTVFFRGKPKGDGLDTDHPLASSALTEYLRRRGVQIGYDKPITWYSIRRRAATDMVRRVGLEATRFMLGHSPGSHTLEVYYLNMLAYFDNQGVLLEEGISNNGVSNASSEWHPLALEKLEGAAFQKSRGHALDDLIRRIIHADDYAPGVDADSTEMMNYRRRVKRFAERVLIDREGDWQRRKMKKSDMDERKARLTASKFTDGVVERALESMSQQGSGLEEGRDPDDEQGQQDDSEDTFVSQEDDQAQPEGDLEDVQNEAAGSVDLDEQGRLNMTMDADVDATNDRQLHESSYKALARAAMELWLHNPMSAHTIWRERSAEDKMCPDCKDDDTVDERTRVCNTLLHLRVHRLTALRQTRPFLSEAKLNDHLGGNFHHPAAKWRRGVEKHFCDRGKFTCPYCFHAGEPEPFTCHEIALLIRHIQESTGEDPSVDHDLLKTDDGWYEPDWEDPLHLQPSAGSQLKYQQKGKREMKKLGIDTTPMPTLLTPEPHASGGALLRGSLPPQPLHARYKDSIVSHPEATALDATIPPHLRGVITTGYNPALSRIPDYLHGVVVRKEKPSSSELDGDEEEGE